MRQASLARLIQLGLLVMNAKLLTKTLTKKSITSPLATD
jgi:hypothetical protein